MACTTYGSCLRLQCGWGVDLYGGEVVEHGNLWQAVCAGRATPTCCPPPKALLGVVLSSPTIAALRPATRCPHLQGERCTKATWPPGKSTTGRGCTLTWLFHSRMTCSSSGAACSSHSLPWGAEREEIANLASLEGTSG